MQSSRLKSFNYAVGMFGTSIPINMLKTYAAIFYVGSLGLTTEQFSLMPAPPLRKLNTIWGVTSWG